MPFVISVGPASVPVGTYPAKFTRVEHYTSTDRSDLPPALKLIWQVMGGDHDGQEAYRVVSLRTGPRANLPVFLRALAGRDLTPGEEIDIERYYGVRGTITVEETESGGTRVEGFVRRAAP